MCCTIHLHENPLWWMQHSCFKLSIYLSIYLSTTSIKTLPSPPLPSLALGPTCLDHTLAPCCPSSCWHSILRRQTPKTFVTPYCAAYEPEVSCSVKNSAHFSRSHKFRKISVFCVGQPRSTKWTQAGDRGRPNLSPLGRVYAVRNGDEAAPRDGDCVMGAFGAR